MLSVSEKSSGSAAISVPVAISFPAFPASISFSGDISLSAGGAVSILVYFGVRSDITRGFTGLRFAEEVRCAAAAAGAVDVAAVVFEAATAFFCWLTACVRAIVC